MFQGALYAGFVVNAGLKFAKKCPVYFNLKLPSPPSPPPPTSYLPIEIPGMQIWGGENVELSLKAWMCRPWKKKKTFAADEAKNPPSPAIDVRPCSRVGHVFRKWSPYAKNRKEHIIRNNIRVAQVWMDEFKFLYFDR